MTAANAPSRQHERLVHRGYRFDVEPCAKRIRAEVDGTVVADSGNVLVMRETRLPPVYYFPPTDVRSELLVPSDHRSHCPFKGDASYWHLKVGKRVIENPVWSYLEPFEEETTKKPAKKNPAVKKVALPAEPTVMAPAEPAPGRSCSPVPRR